MWLPKSLQIEHHFAELARHFGKEGQETYDGVVVRILRWCHERWLMTVLAVIVLASDIFYGDDRFRLRG
jgi:hypothetical protein